MTRSAFANAVRADEKWVENAASILQLQLLYTREEAVWLGLVRELVSNAGLTLARAKEVADEALGRPRAKKTVVNFGESAVGVEVDLPRYYSSFIAAFSAAQVFGEAKRRGRSRRRARGKQAAIDAAIRYGVDVDLLREGLKRTPGERLEQLSENAEFAAELRRGTHHR